MQRHQVLENLPRLPHSTREILRYYNKKGKGLRKPPHDTKLVHAVHVHEKKHKKVKKLLFSCCTSSQSFNFNQNQDNKKEMCHTTSYFRLLNYPERIFTSYVGDTCKIYVKPNYINQEKLGL